MNMYIYNDPYDRPLGVDMNGEAREAGFCPHPPRHGRNVLRDKDTLGDGGFRTLPVNPRDSDRNGGFRTLPVDPRGSERDGGFMPHGGPDFPRGGGRPPFGMEPPHRGPGGMPPRRPNPDFLREHIEEADLFELLAMAGRMLHRRPDGGPARAQTLILSILAGRETLSQRELQDMLGVQPGSLSEILSKLERKGLLVREKAEDRRGNLLRITDEGRQAATEGVPSPESDFFAALTEEQQRQLGEMLRTLLKDWIARFDRGDRRAPECGRFVPLTEKPPKPESV